jgi:hypothetical protein
VGSPGYIKKPGCVHFVIKSKPLTKEAEQKISLYIKKRKEENAKKKGNKKNSKAKAKA